MARPNTIFFPLVSATLMQGILVGEKEGDGLSERELTIIANQQLDQPPCTVYTAEL